MESPDTNTSLDMSSYTGESSTKNSQSSGYQTLEDDIAIEDFMETEEKRDVTNDSQMLDTTQGDIFENNFEIGYGILQGLRDHSNLRENDHMTVYIKGFEIDENTNIQELLQADSRILKVIIKKEDDIEADNENIEFIEVMFTFKKSRDSTAKIVLHKIFHQGPKVFDIEFKDSQDECYIRSAEHTGKYLTCSNGKLTLSPIENVENDSHKFKLYRFTAQQVDNERHSQIELRWFESLSENKFITVEGLNSVKLRKPDRDTMEFNTRKPDGRFFKLLRATQGYHYLESVVNHGSYLCLIDGQIKLKIRNNIDKMVDAGNTSEDENLYIG